MTRMINSIQTPLQLPAAAELRSMLGTWAIAAFLPLPVLVAIDPNTSADVSCLYLGIINAWLVAEFHRVCGLPASSVGWRARMMAIVVAVSSNVALFVGFGFAAGVQTHFPFPLMAVLSAIPVIGIMPWMLRRLPQHAYAAILFSGFLVFACKLAACVVARLVYGPDYLSQGYAAADWRTAKLMITLLWTFSTALSVGLLAVDFRSCARKTYDLAT